MKTIDTISNKDIRNKDYRKTLAFHPVKVFLFMGLLILFSGSEELYSQSVNQLSNSVNHDNFGDDCNDYTCGDNDDKLLICHVPPGNPDNEHEICISSNAVQTHLNHDDYCGPCTLLSNPSQENSTNISIYPNPFTYILFVELNQDLLTNNKNLEIIIFDLLGRTIKRVTPISTTNFELDLSELNNGIFIYNIRNDQDLIGKGKIVKH